MCTGGAVGQFADGDIIAVTHLEVILLHTDHENEGVGVLDAVTIPHTDEERHPVEI